MVCNKRSDVSLPFSKAAWHLLNAGFEKVLEDPNDLFSRSQMQIGAAFAGAAIENSMLGIAHSCANPLTAHFGIVHGQAVGVMLPHVIRFNRADASTAATYDSLRENLDQRVFELLERCGLKTNLSDLEVDQKMIPQLAEEAAQQWTAQFNPVPVEAEDLVAIYEKAY